MRLRVGNRSWPLLVPVAAFLTLFFLIPYANMVRVSFLLKAPTGAYTNVFTIDNYARVLGDSFQWRILQNTIWYSLITTVIALVLGFPLAYAIAHASRRVRPLLLMLLISPLLVGVVVRSYGWMIILGTVGLVNQLLKGIGLPSAQLMDNPMAVIIGLVHVLLPFMSLSIAGALQNIPPEVERAARSLGASPSSVFWRVTWPLSLPGVFSGTLLVFVLAVSSYVLPILLGGNHVLVMPILIVLTLLDAFNWPLGSAQAMVFFGLTAVLLWIYVKLMNRAMRWSHR